MDGESLFPPDEPEPELDPESDELDEDDDELSLLDPASPFDEALSAFLPLPDRLSVL